MSKTLVSVLEVAAVVGLQFIPGVGQFVGTALGVSARAGLAIATVALSAAEAGLNSALAPGAPKPEITEMSLKAESLGCSDSRGEPFAPCEDDGEEWIMSPPPLRSRNRQSEDDLFEADYGGHIFA